MSQIQPLPDSETTDLAMRLMAIPGCSGYEQRVSDFIRGRLGDAGLRDSAVLQDTAHRRSAFVRPDGKPGECGNLIVKLPGQGVGRRSQRRMLLAHADTVPICVGSQPVKSGGLVSSADPATGLGADNRSGCAVVLATALAALRHEGPRPPLTLLWTVQEEVGLQGARHLAVGRLGGPAVAYNFDGGAADKLTVGATGGYRMSITVTGAASHAGGHPERGISAIAVASLAVADLTRNGWLGLIKKGGKTGAANVGVISGGDATNVVADRVELQAEARSHDPAFRERIVAQIDRALAAAVQLVTNDAGETGGYSIQGKLDYEAFRLASSAPVVRSAAEAVRAVGREAEIAVTNGGIDANWLNAHGIPTVTLGCGQRSIHTAEEQLELADFHAACRIAAHLVSNPPS